MKELEEWGLDGFPFEEEIPSDEDLIGEEKNNKPSIKITFNSFSLSVIMWLTIHFYLNINTHRNLGK